MKTNLAHWTFLVGTGDIADALRAFHNIGSDVASVAADARQTISPCVGNGGGNFILLEMPGDFDKDDEAMQNMSELHNVFLR